MNIKLSTVNLSKSFRDLKVLENINIHIKKGEFVSIVGPSGCGKSTLFDVISGIENYDDGEILIDQRKLNKRQGHFGYMFQDPLLLPWRNVEQNIILGAAIKKINQKSALSEARNLLEKFGLDGFAKYYPGGLSGGMKQRIALLRTVLFQKNFMLLDEPFGALDSLTRLECQIWLKNLWKQFKSSILFVTHDIREAIFLSERIYVMSKRPGKIISEITNVRKKNPVILEKTLLNLLLTK